jgi:hypothetical protein
MTIHRDRQRFEQALSSPNPSVALEEFAMVLKAEGMAQVTMYHLFAEYQFKTDSADPLHDAIVNNMDLIWGGGWAKGRSLFENELTSADIAKPLPEFP